MARRISTVAIGIGAFCYIFGFFFLLTIVSDILTLIATNKTADIAGWCGFIGKGLFVVISAILGTGIMYLRKQFLYTLLGLLAVSVGTMAIVIFMILVLLGISSALGTSFYQLLKDGFQSWPSFLFAFLAQIIILYYLSRPDVREIFE